LKSGAACTAEAYNNAHNNNPVSIKSFKRTFIISILTKYNGKKFLLSATIHAENNIILTILNEESNQPAV
jgi:hypothetical protein